MRKLFLILFVLTSLWSYSQEYWDSWNENYTEIDPIEMIKLEFKYADSIRSNDVNDDYFLRMDTYRFSATYLGVKRDIPDSTKQSMSRVYKIFGNPDYLAMIKDLKYEYQFNIGDEIIWIPMQNLLNKAFKKEVNKSDNVYLYCLYLNEHTLDGILFNNFLISEFYKK